MVSIHASVKDATFAKVGIISLVDVSIHASVKDATKAHRPDIPACWFQSTHL